MILRFDKEKNQLVLDLKDNVIHSYNENMFDADDEVNEKLEELGISFNVTNGRFVAASKEKEQVLYVNREVKE